MLGVSVHFLQDAFVDMVAIMVGECLQLDHPRFRDDFLKLEGDPAAAGIWHVPLGVGIDAFMIETMAPWWRFER